MILGMSLPTFTSAHVIISLVAIAAGFVVLRGMLASKRLDGWTAVFLATTVLTSVTGFFFPSDQLKPSHIVGIISLVMLAIALFALYGRRATGAWRWIYVTSALISLYLNVFVSVVQSFMKIPGLQSLAPTQSEPPFIVTQVVVMLVFIVLGFFAIRQFHPEDGANPIGTAISPRGR